MKVILALVGEKAGGKETVGDWLLQLANEHKCSTSRNRFSDIINATLALWGLPADRDHQQKLSVSMRQTFGDGTLTRAVKNRLAQSDADLVILDGVRWLTDESMIRTFQRDEHILLYVTAELEKRFERSKARRREGEAEKTLAQFIAEEKVDTEIDIPVIGQRADFKIENNDTKEEFRTRVKEFFAKEILPRLKKEN